MSSNVAMKKSEDLAIWNYQLLSQLSHKVRYGSQIINEDFCESLERVIDLHPWENVYVVQRKKLFQFNSLREWIETDPPEGCGANVEAIRALLQRPEWNLLREKFEAALNPSRQGGNQDSETGKFVETNRLRHHVANGDDSEGRDAERKSVERNRAVVRTPDFVQGLYKDGLINKVEASLLGAKKPDTDKQQRIEKAVERLQAIVEANPEPTQEIEKDSIRKQVTQAVREEMGVINKSIAIAQTEMCYVFWGILQSAPVFYHLPPKNRHIIKRGCR
jgi:hypothetical protein